MEVHYRQDNQFVADFVVMVNDSIRESADETPPNVFFNKGPHIGMF